MQTLTVCASHSPLMYTGVEESRPGLHRSFFERMDRIADQVDDFRPDLVVLFAPDHFNALYYDLMPGFCILAEATASTDWHQPAGRLAIPRERAVALARAVQADGFDPALSLRMRVDHGMTIALRQILRGYDRYPVLPVYINCAGDPRPSVRRAREFGAAVGRFVAKEADRVLVIGSGGLSHDPPTPRITTSRPTPEQEKRLVIRHEASENEFRAREARVVDLARRLAAGEQPILPPDEAWDRDFVNTLIAGDLTAFDALADDEIDRKAGFGGHEIRCWIAAFAAAQSLGTRGAPRLEYYEIIPEWITGMAVVTA